MSVLTYSGPYEVLVDRPVTITGRFDPDRVTQVAVLVEDKFPLTATLNDTDRTWKIDFPKGFTQPGVRWLRLRGTDRAGKIVGDRVIYVTVNSEPMVAAHDLSVRVVRPTVFKASPASSSTLGSDQKVELEAGTVLQGVRYGVSGTHIQVELTQPLGSVGQFGYFYRPHVRLAVGNDALYFDKDELPPVVPGGWLLWIKQKTKLKSKPEDSSVLSELGQLDLLPGRTFAVLGYACTDGHFRVTFANPVIGFGNSGFLFHQHVALADENGPIEYDREAITVTPIRNTVLKKRPIDSSRLADADKITLPIGRIYGVSNYAVETGHLRVNLTESLPNFGDRGYLFPDFVQLEKGDKPINLSPALDYIGPTEIAVGRAVVLNGTFDPVRASTVSVVAEDRFSLPVSVDRVAGTWQVNLQQGFQQAGARWLRVRATNTAGEVVGDRIVELTITADPNAGEAINLTVMRDTFFKSAPTDSSQLGDHQKVMLRRGQTFGVKTYGYIDGHLKLTLTNPITPIGDFGFVFEPHVQVKKGNDLLRFDIEDVPDVPMAGQMLVTRDTWIKLKPEDSSNLGSTQKAMLRLGQTFGVLGYASIAGHFRITLTESVTGFGNVGYVYWQHVQLRKDGETILYDPDALTATILQTTALKRRPTDASRLNANEKATLPLGRIYGVAGYSLEDGHIKATLTEELPGYGNTGYLYPGHIQMRRGGRGFNPYPRQIELNAPYFSQRDNPRYYWSTCNVTAIAMVLYYHGLRPSYSSQLEDELLEWVFSHYGVGSQVVHNVLSAMIQAYGFDSTFSTTRNWAQIDAELASRRPVVLAGEFTATGHIITVIGYTPSGLIVHDPWGDALTGYANTNGRRLLYPNAYLLQTCGYDGGVWAHFIKPR